MDQVNPTASPDKQISEVYFAQFAYYSFKVILLTSGSLKRVPIANQLLEGQGA